MATYRGGVVSAEDIASWRRYRELRTGRPAAELPLRDEVEPIVLMRVLDRRFDALSPEAKAEHAIRWRHWKLALAETRLRDALRKEAAPSEAEIRGAFDADPSAYGLPRHWQLDNILKRFPEGAGAEERARLRRSMERIRERVVAGEDFARLAREESESQTRLRGGTAGAVRLDQLAPQVARVVSGMKPGDLSPVIESTDGLMLLRCTGILEPQEPSLDRARRAVSLRLGGERFEAAWAALVTRLDRELEAAYPPVELAQGPPSDVVATFRDGQGRSSVTRQDFLLHASGRGVAPASAPAAELHRRLEERVRQEGFLREAERRGLLAGEGDDVLFEWKAREMRARAVEWAEVESRVPEPAEKDLRAAHEARPERYVSPARVALRGLKLVLRRDRPLTVYEEARKIGDRLAAGEMRFEDAVTILRPQAELVELGRLTADEVWSMGLNVDTAVAATPAGGTTRLVQEGRTLWILRVLSKEPERQLTFPEAREQIRQSLLDAARRRAVDESRKRIVEEQAVSLAP